MTSSPSKTDLQAENVGKTLHQLPTPSAILDLAKLELNCDLMLQAVKRLDLRWRPHIKTHKVRFTKSNNTWSHFLAFIH